MKKFLPPKGFTLVELLVVMAIIGILATVVLSGFRSSQTRSRDAKRKSDLRQISQALELFYADHNAYPSSASGQIMSCPFAMIVGTCDWDNLMRFEDTIQGRLYFRQLPDDPRQELNYHYRTLLGNQAYQLYAHLENNEDNSCPLDVNGDHDCSLFVLPAGFPADGCGSQACNFAITSTNVAPAD